MRADERLGGIGTLCKVLVAQEMPMPATPYTVWKVAQAAR